MLQSLRDKLQWIANEIVELLSVKDDAYKSSWKSRGGFSAFFQLDRKYSRLEVMAEECEYDIFKVMKKYPEEGPETLKDLVAYALLILSETYEPNTLVVDVPTRPEPCGCGATVDFLSPHNVVKCGSFVLCNRCMRGEGPTKEYVDQGGESHGD